MLIVITAQTPRWFFFFESFGIVSHQVKNRAVTSPRRCAGLKRVHAHKYMWKEGKMATTVVAFSNWLITEVLPKTHAWNSSGAVAG